MANDIGVAWNLYNLIKGRATKDVWRPFEELTVSQRRLQPMHLWAPVTGILPWRRLYLTFAKDYQTTRQRLKLMPTKCLFYFPFYFYIIKPTKEQFWDIYTEKHLQIPFIYLPVICNYLSKPRLPSYISQERILTMLISTLVDEICHIYSNLRLKCNLS